MPLDYQLELVTGPASEPLTLAEAKLHSRVDVSDDDTLITRLIVAMRQVAEVKLKRRLVSQTWDLTLDAWPSPRYRDGRLRESLYVPLSSTAEIGEELGGNVPLQSVTSITYLDANRATQTVSPTDYRVVPGIPGRIFPVTGKSWPAVLREPAVITIRFVCGFASASDPRLECVKEWMLMNLGTFYDNRESVVVGSAVTPITLCDSLLSPLDWGGGMIT